MAIVNELITQYSFTGDLALQERFNTNLEASVDLLAEFNAASDAASQVSFNATLKDAINLLTGVGQRIAGVATDLFTWVNAVSGSIEPLIQFSDQTGVAIETLQTLGYAADVNSVSAETLQASLGKMTERVSEFIATGGGKAKDVVNQLGLQFQDMNGQAKSSDVIFQDLADKMQGMSQNEKFSVLDKMGIDRSMVQLLSLTGDEISALQGKASALGVVTRDQAEQFHAYNNAVKTLSLGFEGISFDVAMSFVPALQEVTEGFADFLAANNDLIKSGLSNLSEILLSIVGMVGRLAPIVAGATAVFAAWWLVTGGLATSMALLLSPAVLITATILAIILVVDDLVLAMEGGKSVIADFFMDTWGIDIVPGLLAVKEAVMAVVDYIIAVFAQGIENVKLLFSALAKLISGDFQGAWNDVANAFSASIVLFQAPFQQLEEWVIALFSHLGDTIANTINNAASSAWNATKSFFGLGDDEKTTAIPAPGIGVKGMPYGIDSALGIAGGGFAPNNSFSFNQQNYISAPDAIAAGHAVVDSSQQQQREAQRYYQRGGR